MAAGISSRSRLHGCTVARLHATARKLPKRPLSLAPDRVVVVVQSTTPVAVGLEPCQILSAALVLHANSPRHHHVLAVCLRSTERIHTPST